MEHTPHDLNKVKELALKLKEMADRGEVNEKSVAYRKLTSLLNKYGLTLNDVQNNNIKQRSFRFKHEDEASIVAHVIWSIVPNVKVLRRGKNKVALCELNAEQYIEVKEKLKFYLDHFSKEKETFILAYIFKNNLEIKSESNKDEESDLDVNSIVKMMNGIQTGKFESNKKSYFKLKKLKK